ncbi:zinc finger protein 629 [Drosophila subobscura]|uniref:zinc finger protein 629 n=1 Tax=Drosophila subobscura TaxID=7241 RepID=UPI00155B1361|nr:zinc finger protein 629 [Drosophila subobscura]
MAATGSAQPVPAGGSFDFDAAIVCRICLRSVTAVGEEMHFIYDEAPVEQGANLAQILNECTRYTCDRFDDKMPHKMCEQCTKAARHAYRFKRDAEKSYCSLMALLGRTLNSSSSDVCTQTEQVALLPCGMCHDQFLNSLELRLHRNRVHKARDNGSSTGTGPNASASEGAVVQQLKCKFCPLHFTHLRQLRTHLARSHSQAERLQCPHCQTAFTRRDHMLRHIRNIHKKEADSTWPPLEDEATMQSCTGDELVSAEVLLNEDENDEGDAYQCNINPISSNEEEDELNDEEAKNELWLHIKPEPCLEAEDLHLKLEKKLRRRKGKTETEEERRTTSEAAAVKDEPLPSADTAVQATLHIKEESQPAAGSLNDDEHENEGREQDDFMDDSRRPEVPLELPLSDEDGEEEDYEYGDEDEESDLEDDDHDEDDGEEMDEVPPEGVDKSNLEIVRDYLRKGKPLKRRRRNKQSGEANPENRCDVCQRTFSRHCHLLRHKLSHLEKKPHSCPQCPKAFARSDHLKAHVQSLHSNKEHKCTLCEAAFARPEALDRHKVSKHNGEGLVAGSKLNLQLAEHTCEYCSKRFSSKTYLRKHTLLHTDFLYACKSCEETFKERQQLREHEKSHTGQRNFLCCICGDSFARNDYLRVHMRRHNGEKPYKCRYCVKAFPRATDLKVHERYHTGTKPNLCNTCGKSFHRAYNLTIHMRTHTGERPYMCDQCPKSFTQSNDLKAHIRRHTGERYKCPHCDAYFLQLYNMRNHCLSAHNKHIETKTGRLQRTGLLEDATQSHLTTVVMPPVRYQSSSSSSGQDPNQQLEQQMGGPVAAMGTGIDGSSATINHHHSPPEAASAYTVSPVTTGAVPTTLATSAVAAAAAVTTIDGVAYAPAPAPAPPTPTPVNAAPFGAFNFPPVVMAHLMYNHAGGSQHSQSGSETGK